MRRVVLIGLLVVVVGTGLLVTFRSKQRDAHLSARDTMQAALGRLAERQGDHPAMKLAGGLMPPTNKWFSGAVFGDTSQPIFGYPLSYKFGNSSFEVGYPNVTSTPNAVFAPHTKSLEVQIADASRYAVSYYDDLVVVMTYYKGDAPLADVTVARGSPYYYVTARDSARITTVVNGLRKDNGKLVAPGPNASIFGFYTEESATPANDMMTIALPKGTMLSGFVMPDGAQKDVFFAAAPHALQKATTAYTVTDNTVVTTISAQTRDNKETILTFQPGDAAQDAMTVAAYTSLQGPLQAIKGKNFSFATTAPAKADLKLNMLSVEERNDVKAKLAADVQTLTLTKSDTYFGSKELYRAANLLTLADQLQMNDQKQKVQTQLKDALHGWLMSSKDSPRAKKYFYYDTAIKSVIGTEPSFGSQELNDHHFHYGYFIYAASILGKYDQDFVKQDGPMVNLLVEDIASESNGPNLPRLRNFDVWTGHSYASGYSPFADGNNQESSSEATNAWGGIVQWAEVTNNTALRDRGTWLLAREAQAARKQWFIANNNELPYKGYVHKLVSLVWDGKRDYATFFSPRPQAQLGIQLIPMSSAHAYLGSIPKQEAEAYIAEAAPTDAELNGQFGDYIVMFMAQYDKARAKALLPTLTSATALDDGNSLAYLTAWVYAGGLR